MVGDAVWVWVGVMRVMLVGMMEPLRVAGPWPKLAAVGQSFFLTAVFFLRHLGDAEQLLVVLRLRRQLKDPLKNLLITVRCFQLRRMQVLRFTASTNGSIKVG